MLDSMRTLTNHLIGRIVLAIVMGFIIMSFGIWGIADFFRGFGQGNLAQVGHTEITLKAYRTAYQRELQLAQQQARRVISTDEAHRAGLDRMALSNLITDEAINQKVNALSLGMSDEAVAQILVSDPDFKSASGEFDKVKFEATLRNSGYSEAAYVAEQKRNSLRHELTEAIAGTIKAPDVLLDMFNQYAAEKRDVDYITLTAANAGDIALPEPSVLEDFFAARKADFRAPEYRKVVTLALTPATAAKPDQVSAEDVAALYEKVKAARYTQAETRDLQQITFPNAEDATAALAKIKSGMSFAALADERKLKATDIELGTKAKSELFDKAVAEAGFALAADAVSDPIKTPFGFALIHAAAIHPEMVKSLDAVSADLRKEIAQQRAKTDIQTLHDKIEDQRAAGKILIDAAKAAGLDAKVIEAVDSTGLDKEGKPALDPIEPLAVIKAIYASDIGVDNDTILTRDGGYVWFEIQKIDPARDRTLDEVKDKVIAAWKAEEITKKLSALATDSVSKINSGTSLNDIAVALGNLTIKTAKGVQRSGKSELSSGFVAQVFNQPADGAGSVALDNGDRAIFKVLNSTVPPLDKSSDAMKQVAERLNAGLAEDMLNQYLAKIQADIGVKVNEQVFRQATGQN